MCALAKDARRNLPRGACVHGAGKFRRDAFSLTSASRLFCSMSTTEVNNNNNNAAETTTTTTNAGSVEISRRTLTEEEAAEGMCRRRAYLVAIFPLAPLT